MVRVILFVVCIEDNTFVIRTSIYNYNANAFLMEYNKTHKLI